MKTYTLTFVPAKATKNTIKYEEKAPAGKPPVVGVLYVQKWAVEDPSKSITVTVKA